ncbi:MAG: protein containing Planctomycete extracellular domain protein, partial [Planctomycetota bacterium]|nr:protein containing Planctomycete extracellular domain protein [Planctomycetota bacterium]
MFEEILRNLKRKSKREIGSRHTKARRLQGEHLEDRALLTAVPLGALPTDTGEFLLGRVAVTPVLFESNGQIDTETQNWTSEEIDAVLAKVTEGVGWWSDLLDT